MLYHRTITQTGVLGGTLGSNPPPQLSLAPNVLLPPNPHTNSLYHQVQLVPNPKLLSDSVLCLPSLTTMVLISGHLSHGLFR